MLRELVAFFAVVGITYAAIQRGPLQQKPEKYKDVKGCYISEFDEVIPFGQNRPSSDRCEEYWCSENLVQLVSCSIFAVSPPLELVEEKDKPYPDCCPKLKENLQGSVVFEDTTSESA